MNGNLSKQFGLIIAYLLPGFIGLAGMAPLFPPVAGWLRPMNQGDFGVGPTVYAILSAITMGMIVSCFRWLLIDHLLHWTGIRRPAWDDSQLDSHLGAFDYLVEAHYRYYQFYANAVVAIASAYGLNRFMETSPLLGIGTDLGVAILCTVLFVGSRDALSNYYKATIYVVGQVAEKDHAGKTMTNGRGHDSVACATTPRTGSETKSLPKPKVQAKPQTPPPHTAAAEPVEKGADTRH